MSFDPDAPPITERTVRDVRTWGDLLPGDVINGSGKPATITRIEPSPFPWDLTAALDEANERRRGKTARVWLGGVARDEPMQPLTAADVMDAYDWKPLIDDPRQIDLWVSFPDRKRERRGPQPFPIHQRINWRVVVAVGPDPHFSVCGICGYLWPCPHETVTSDARRVLEAEAAKCTYCQKRISNGSQAVTAFVVDAAGPREFKFHGRKGPCLNAALRIDPENVSNQRAEIERVWS